MTERNRLIKQPEMVYIPAIRHVPAKPAYCITYQVITGYGPFLQARTERRLVCMMDYDYGIAYRNAIASGKRPPPQCSMTTVYISAGRTTYYRTETKCFPAIKEVKARSASIVRSASNSWDAGARSIVKLPDQHYLNLRIKEDPVAIIVGLSSDRRIDYNFDSLDQAVIFRSEGVRPLSSGTEGNLFPAATSLRIERSLGRIKFIAGGQVISNFIDTGDDLYCYVLLYSLSDYVEYPALSEIPISNGESEFSIESLIDPTPQGLSEFSIKTEATASANGAFASSGVSVFKVVSSTGTVNKIIQSYGDAVMSIETSLAGIGVFQTDKNNSISSSSGTTIIYATGSLAASGKASSADYLVGQGTFPVPTIRARISKPEMIPPEALGLFPVPIIMAGTILSGGVLTATGTAYSTGKASSSSYLGGKAREATRYAISGWFAMTPEGFISSHEQLELVDHLALDASVFFAFHDGVSIGGELDIYLLLSLTMYEALSASDDFSFASMLEILIHEGLSISPKSSIARSEALQYAVNAITGAVSRYSNFGFKQFASAQGVTYAITDNGLYELTGSTDEDNTIKAAIDFGASDFGTAQSKRVSSVYAGIATDGEAYIRVVGDRGESHVYKAIQYSDEARAHTAKGISARHWRIGLELTDSTYAELDNVEIEIAVSQRRLKGRP